MRLPYRLRSPSKMLVRIYQKDPLSPVEGKDPTAFRTVFCGYMNTPTLDGLYMQLEMGDFPTTYQGTELHVGDLVEVLDDIPAIVGIVDYPDEITGIPTRSIFYDTETLETELHYAENFQIPHLFQDYRSNPMDMLEKGLYEVQPLGWEKITMDTEQCQPMEGYRCLFMSPGQKAVDTYVRSDLTSLQKAVSEYGEDALIEVSYPLPDNALVVGNEEARLQGMAGNRYIGDLSYAGPILILGDNGEGDFCSLTPEQIQHYGTLYENPVNIPAEELSPDMSYRILSW